MTDHETDAAQLHATLQEVRLEEHHITHPAAVERDQKEIVQGDKTETVQEDQKEAVQENQKGAVQEDQEDTVQEDPSNNNGSQTSSITENEKEDGDTPIGGEPNQREQQTLERVGEKLPFAVFLVAIIELCERFTYYGCQGTFQNYVTKPFHGNLGTGGLGMSHMAATGLVTFYQFWCYVTPLAGGLISDQYLGKYKTILCSAGVYMVGLLVLACTSIPKSLTSGHAMGGFVASIVLTGIGTGGIKANVSPLIAEQYTRRHMEIALNKKGQRVIIDPYITIQHIYMMFYWSINIGALSLLATPYMERIIGFWSAYVLALCMFIMGTTILVLGRKVYVDRPPSGTVVVDAFRVIGWMARRRSMDSPKPSYIAERGGSLNSVRWDDQFVEEVKRTLQACKVFLIYPIFWVCYSQFSTNFVSQAMQMRGHGIPNDLMQNFDPIAIIVFIPVMDYGVYPLLRKFNIRLKPIARIVFGFWVMSLAMAYAAILQHYVYMSPPCYQHPLCPASIINGKKMGNDIHIAIQAPAYVLIGIGEIFGSATGYEYAYTKAPPRMKGFVQSLFLLTTAFGSALGEAFLPALYDPAIMYVYTGLAAGCFTAGCVVWMLFRKLNEAEDDMNYIENDVTVDLNSPSDPEAVETGRDSKHEGETVQTKN